MLKCSECGSSFEAKHRFCSKCGNDLKVQRLREERAKLEAKRDDGQARFDQARGELEAKLQSQKDELEGEFRERVADLDSSWESARADLDAKIAALQQREQDAVTEPVIKSPAVKAGKNAPVTAPVSSESILTAPISSSSPSPAPSEISHVRLPLWALVLVVLGIGLLLYSVSGAFSSMFAPSGAAPSPVARLTGAAVAGSNLSDSNQSANATPTARAASLACNADSDCVLRAGECCSTSNGVCTSLVAQCSQGGTPLFEGCGCSSNACAPRYRCVAPSPTPASSATPTAVPTASATPTPSPTATPLPAPNPINLQALTTTINAEVSWLTDVSSNSTLSWGKDYPGSDGNASKFLYATSHYYKLDALFSNTTYKYTITLCRLNGACRMVSSNFTTRAS